MSRGRPRDILFIGFNTISVPFGLSMLMQGADEFSLIFYVNDDTGGKANNGIREGVVTKDSTGNGTRRGSKTSGRKSSSKLSTSRAMSVAPKTPQDDTSTLEVLLTASGRFKSKVKIVRDMHSLKNLKSADFIIFASSSATLSSAKAMALKNFLAGAFGDAVWIHLSIHPQLSCIEPPPSSTQNFFKILAVPLYTMYKLPAGEIRAEIKYWYGQNYPVYMEYPNLDEPVPDVVQWFFGALKRRKLFVNTCPVVNKSPLDFGNYRDEIQLTKLTTNFEQRHWLLPLYLDIEFRFWCISMEYSENGGKTVEIESEDMKELVFNAFNEIQSCDSGIFNLIGGFNFYNVQRMISVIEQRMKRAGSDNSGAGDILDAISRINDYRFCLNDIVTKSGVKMPNCLKLLEKTDVLNYRNMKIWVQNNMIYR